MAENEIVDLAPNVPLAGPTKDDIVRWLDGLWYSVEGKPTTRGSRADDLNMLQIAVRTGADRDSLLAAKLGMEVTDKRFLASLFRLQQKACMIRISRKSDYRGFWGKVPDPTFKITSKGDFLAHSPLPED
jgi:hypothetical protein